MEAKNKKNLFLKAFDKYKGGLTFALKDTNTTELELDDWLEKDINFKVNYENIKKNIVDFAKIKLYEKVNEGDLKAIIYVLDNLGKNDGFGKNNDTEKSTNFEINIKIPENLKILPQNENEIEL